MTGVASVWRDIGPKYNLIGSKCTKCEKIYFPPESLCACGSNEFESFRFSGEGEIVTFSIIRVAPEGFEAESPYILAIVGLKEGVRTTGQVVGVTAEDTKLKIGAKVKSVFRKISEDGRTGVIHYGYKFEIVE